MTDNISIILGVIAMAVSVVFFILAQRASAALTEQVARIQEIARRLDDQSLKLIEVSIESMINRGARDSQLMESFLTSKDELTARLIDRMRDGIRESQDVPGGEISEEQFKDEFVQLASDTIREGLDEELVHQLENRRDDILLEMTRMEAALEANSMTEDDKLKCKGSISRLREQLDLVKGRLREVTGHT